MSGDGEGYRGRYLEIEIWGRRGVYFEKVKRWGILGGGDSVCKVFGVRGFGGGSWEGYYEEMV